MESSSEGMIDFERTESEGSARYFAMGDSEIGEKGFCRLVLHTGGEGKREGRRGKQGKREGGPEGEDEVCFQDYQILLRQGERVCAFDPVTEMTRREGGMESD